MKGRLSGYEGGLYVQYVSRRCAGGVVWCGVDWRAKGKCIWCERGSAIYKKNRVVG